MRLSNFCLSGFRSNSQNFERIRHLLLTSPAAEYAVYGCILYFIVYYLKHRFSVRFMLIFEFFLCHNNLTKKL